MLDAESLKKCYEIISRLDNSRPLWIPSYTEARNLSFISKVYDFRDWVNERNKFDIIFNNIKTYDDFEEFIDHLSRKIEQITSDDEVRFCNEVLSCIFNDRHISRAIKDGGVIVIPNVNPQRYVRFIAIKRILSKVQTVDMFAFWQKVNNFSDIERELFNGRPFKFHKRLIHIMYGYASGDIRIAYANGIDILDKYKKLLAEVCTLEKNIFFSYLPEWQGSVFYGNDEKLLGALREIDKARAGVISSRNDNSLAERAFVAELLKLFYEYGNTSPTAAVYRFTRSNFMLSDVERKTIQRCWDSLSLSIDKSG